jgi:hypothetical protein
MSNIANNLLHDFSDEELCIVENTVKRMVSTICVMKMQQKIHQDLIDANELTDDDVEWVVNNRGELGVKIGNKMFFLYKGESLSYKHDNDHELPMLYRRVNKREFGETCKPDGHRDDVEYLVEGDYSQNRWKPMFP